ncbi:MAG: hypothetical protein CMP51_04580 [Flavobacteriales bacterium]|nr:hypothetical protein [Flavobacteriales bacterium]|tara:strand:+ start:1117 stop:1590 length:474 start_codon:yes stop_codon:yes gene_type:complete
MLEGENIYIRKPIESDLEFLFNTENNQNLWKYGSENIEFSKNDILDFILNSKLPINITKQQRFIICKNNKSIGIIDLFNYNSISVSLGIYIEKSYRKNGFASESLKMLISYCCDNLKLAYIYCSVKDNNIASISLFESMGFIQKSVLGNTNYYVYSI